MVPPQYERIVGRDNASVTLSGLEPGTTYRIRVWSTDGRSVSNETKEMTVKTAEGSAYVCSHFLHISYSAMQIYYLNTFFQNLHS